MSMMVAELNDENFEQSVVKSTVPVLVDFWAEWCTPCRMVAPVLEKLAAHYGNDLVIGKLNVDAAQATATKYGVRSIPTLLFFKDGKPMRQFVGFQPEKELRQKLDAALGK
ncbi:MAG: thioredoxin [Chloroflexi bacterium]|nr:thioredoxin [Chloroflexota bacterium]